MHEQSAALAPDLLGRLEAIPERVFAEHDIASEVLRPIPFEARSAAHHYDRGVDAEARCRVGHGLGEVPGRVRDDPHLLGSLEIGKNAVERGADLKRADGLQRLQLEQDSASYDLRQVCRLHDRRWTEVRREPRGGKVDLGAPGNGIIDIRAIHSGKTGIVHGLGAGCGGRFGICRGDPTEVWAAATAGSLDSPLELISQVAQQRSLDP